MATPEVSFYPETGSDGYWEDVAGGAVLPPGEAPPASVEVRITHVSPPEVYVLENGVRASMQIESPVFKQTIPVAKK